MFARSYFVVALLSVVLGGCASRPRSGEPISPSAVAEIYAAVVAHAFPAGRPDTIILASEAATYRELPAGNWLRRAKDTVPGSLVARLGALTIAPQRTATADFPAPVRVISSGAASQIVEERLGGMAFLAVTPVAFADDSSQALVYYEKRCGPLCGSGHELWFIRGADGLWTLRQEITHWRS